jgi:putative toxin-antitoxin system antitoxin component (TIGR02293 family)
MKTQKSYNKPAIDPGKVTVQEPEGLYNLFNNRISLVTAIREGIPFRLFEQIQRASPYSVNEWARLLHLSAKSIKRYEQTDSRFKPIYSEKIIELAEVTRAGLAVFDSMEQFRLWLDTPNFALGGEPPLELLTDSYGKELVISELNRIDHGIFA